jgi:hypothetical protein
MMKRSYSALALFVFIGWLLQTVSFASDQVKIAPEWGNVTYTSKTAISIEVCLEPPMRRGSPIHDQLFKALRDLHADYARYAPWFPYPRLAVPELEPSRDGKTSWDFSLLDPITADFVEATEGHPIVLDISTIPEWMFKTDKPVPYPADPDAIDWDYEQGTELRDPTMKEVADYWARMASWYTKGGFKDEYGNWHASGHHYKVAYWEVLNEIDGEHHMTPEFYTRLYDATVEGIRQTSPDMKFMGLALADPVGKPDYFQYFLDSRNHKPGIPIDMISYHFYTMPDVDETLETMQHTIFDQADKFLTAIRYIESIRARLSPHAKTYIDELGTMLPDPQAPKLARPIPDWYWNLAGAMWAYAYGYLAGVGIDAVGGAELIDYPGQFAATTLVNWETGQPNARYWVLKLLRENFNPGDKLVATNLESQSLFAQAFVTSRGERKILLVNKRDRQVEVAIPGAGGGKAEVVDQTTGSSPPATTSLKTEGMTLNGLAVAVVMLSR